MRASLGSDPFPPSELPKATVRDSEGPTKRRPKRRHQDNRPSYPRWFSKDRNQFIAEWLALNTWIDGAVGIAPDAGRWPYSDYKRATVEKFLELLRPGIKAAQ